MKLLVSYFAMLFILNVAIGQETKMPMAIVNEFESSFPNATDVDWDKEGDLYEVEFEMDEKEHEITYNESGDIMKSNSEIVVSELPEEVKNVLNTHYQDREIDEVKREEKDGQVVYNVELENFIFDDKITISSDGQIAK